MTREEWLKRKSHRQICQLCNEVDRVMFVVPDEVWKLALNEYFWNYIICLQCFTKQADERGVERDKDIKFFPVSQVTQEKNRDGCHRR